MNKCAMQSERSLYSRAFQETEHALFNGRLSNIIVKRRFRPTRFGSKFREPIRIQQEPFSKLYA